MTTKTANNITYAEGQRLAALYPMASHGPQCYEPINVGEYGYRCTREPHREGPHCAHVPGGDVVATWEGVSNFTK